MIKHEGNRMEWRLPRRARFVATVTALVSALALSAPAVAGASTRSYAPITQNTAMIVNVSGLPAPAIAAVSWSDVSWDAVSWSDSYSY